MKRKNPARSTRILKNFCLIGFSLSMVACASSKNFTNLYPVKQGEIIVLQQPCYFIDNPGEDELIPEGNQFLKYYEQNSKGIVPKGTKVEFLGIYAESGFMVDTHIRSYGRILEGEFRRRKINLDYVMEQQCPENSNARVRIEREAVFSQELIEKP
jgi:hypothetical protein